MVYILGIEKKKQKLKYIKSKLFYIKNIPLN